MKGERITKAICNKGFNGNSSIQPRSNFGAVVQESSPQTFTAYSLSRYAHTLLTFAEAKARDNQPDAEAYEAINQIRRRANKVDINNPSTYDLTPGLSANAFADSVIQERAFEFCGEPLNRCFDLLRTGKLAIINELILPYNQSFPLNNNFFYNIPPEELILEPYLNLK
jgi:starch-binding outer membrane protein, SusD/RagB family